ncbi:hypothetical protein A1Q1_03721 [Trichosporon asahii var. asahii CBS 2479]|uniref:Uncharacterized protein n=1 Tax=Trichosporon asahii var. asahii (strain ATCC 90039 / CBS 2479 / JCM 2466 / KCTC 7840 / NBRC 103889/ NCYC 2677 / UAMH 7654) TaxID=1186058 RepID=J5STL9_TRIAS|nr:hypothetical protein A1Q1_03721 [Trichosporon asahii var. asahii CBS 2479]EJT47466.1 hypothetical protein A1Q1_03721 [Trichosporon asahii var. asahii CBS 2479]
MSEQIEKIEVVQVSDTPTIDAVDIHLNHVASIVIGANAQIIGFTLAILAITASLSGYRLLRGLQRRQEGRYTPGEHRILWAVLVVASAYVGHKLWTRLHLAFRVRDLFLAPAFAAGFLWCAQWWLREEQLRYAEYDAQDAKAKQAAKKGGKKVE